MASYRDQINPEALHVPGSFVSRCYLAACIFFCLCLTAALAVGGTSLDRTINTALVAAVVALCLTAWPREIVLDQAGLTQRGPLRTRTIAWSDVGRVEIVSEFGLPLRRRSLPTSSLRLVSSAGRGRIVHTPRHADRHRFAFELQRHGIQLPAELGRITAPNLSRLSSATDPMPEGLKRRWP